VISLTAKRIQELRGNFASEMSESGSPRGTNRQNFHAHPSVSYSFTRAAHLLDESGTRESTRYAEKTCSLSFYDEAACVCRFLRPARHLHTGNPLLFACEVQWTGAWNCTRTNCATELPFQPLEGLRYAIVKVGARREKFKPAPGKARMADDRQGVECSIA
jgi:hypothetical protein